MQAKIDSKSEQSSDSSQEYLDQNHLENSSRFPLIAELSSWGIIKQNTVPSNRNDALDQ